MYLLNLLKSMEELSDKKIAFFIDMDGVVADYRYGEGANIKNNKRGVYLNKRPIYSTINNIKRLYENLDCEFYIISSCLYKDQAKEKEMWLSRYMPFIKKENELFIISSDFKSRKILKVEKIEEYIKLYNMDKVIFIDDTHEILTIAIEKLGTEVLPFHVSTLLD